MVVMVVIFILFLGDLGDHRITCEKQSGNARRVLQGCSNDLRRIDHASLQHVHYVLLVRGEIAAQVDVVI